MQRDGISRLGHLFAAAPKHFSRNRWADILLRTATSASGEAPNFVSPPVGPVLFRRYLRAHSLLYLFIPAVLGRHAQPVRGVLAIAQSGHLIEFGRFAAERRAQRGLGKPETFNSLGFTFICERNSRGQFLVKRITRRDRMRATLREIKDELRTHKMNRQSI